MLLANSIFTMLQLLDRQFVSTFFTPTSYLTTSGICYADIARLDTFIELGN